MTEAADLPAPKPVCRSSYASRFWKISAFPQLSPAQVFCRPNDMVFPFSRKDIVYCWNARVALWLGLEAIGLQPGDRVLVPVYACGSELDVLVARGLTLDFYPIREDLSVDLDALRSIVTADTRALFVVHYFGFSQPLQELDEFIRQHGLLLIEDNAHGLFSRDPRGTPLGSIGDFAIFSLYKSVPVPDGGVLVLKDAVLPIALSGPGLKRVLGKLRQMTESTLSTFSPRLAQAVAGLVLDPLIRLLKRETWQPKPVQGSAGQAAVAALYKPFSEADRRTGMSSFSQHIAATFDAEQVVARRRANYLAVDRAIRQAGGPFRPLMTSLAEGCCPLFYPVLEDSPERCLRRAMLANGIEVHGFGFAHRALPELGFDWERTLKSQVSCLPIHQSLSDRDLQHMLNVILGFAQQSG